MCKASVAHLSSQTKWCASHASLPFKVDGKLTSMQAGNNFAKGFYTEGAERECRASPELRCPPS